MKILPTHIIQETDEIKKMVDNNSVIGVIRIRRRQYGKTLIRQLLQTEDIEHEIVEQKKLPESIKPVQ